MNMIQSDIAASEFYFLDQISLLLGIPLCSPCFRGMRYCAHICRKMEIEHSCFVDESKYSLHSEIVQVPRTWSLTSG